MGNEDQEVILDLLDHLGRVAEGDAKGEIDAVRGLVALVLSSDFEPDEFLARKLSDASKD